MSSFQDLGIYRSQKPYERTAEAQRSSAQEALIYMRKTPLGLCLKILLFWTKKPKKTWVDDI